MAGGGGGGQTSQTQTADPWSGAQGYLKDAYAQAQTAAERTSTAAYDGNFVNPANSTQRGAVDMALGAIPNMDTGGGISRVANESLSGSMLSANPHVQSAIDATIRPTVERARDQYLPAISSAAQSAGAYGGSRHALAQRWAAQDVNKQVADTAAQMWNQNYQNERNIQTQVAPGLVEMANRMQLAPAQAMLDVGNQQYQLDDLVRQNEMAQFEDSINRHWRAINPYIAALSGIGMPGGTTSVTGGGGVNRNTAIAGGAMAGAAAGVPLAGATYGLSIPIGALIGGGASYFGSR